MEQKLLDDPGLEISDQTLAQHCAAYYPALKQLLDTVSSDDWGYTPEWRYYKDGQAWLCKIARKKKTVVWLSAWQHAFRLGFYFTEKTGAGIETLDIPGEWKEFYATAKPIGRLKPLVVDIADPAQLEGAYTVMRYKEKA